MKGTKKGVVFRKRQKTKVEEEEDRESQMVHASFYSVNHGMPGLCTSASL
jgi:hypothetical protein